VKCALVGLHLDVHGTNETSGIETVIPAIITNGLVESGGAEKGTTPEANVMDEGIYHRVISHKRQRDRSRGAACMTQASDQGQDMVQRLSHDQPQPERRR
jgi:hypothetical protein